MHLHIFTPSHPATHPFLGELASSIDRAAIELEEGSDGIGWTIVQHETGDGQQDDADALAIKKVQFDKLACTIQLLALRAGKDSTIGDLKRRACLDALGRGYEDDPRDVLLVEVDADDRLDENALAVLADEFKSRPAMLYADCAHFGDQTGLPYRADYGWRNRKTSAGYTHDQWAITPASLSSILFSPDHLRAYRGDAYLDAGGHRGSGAACDDHDLTQRLYLQHGADQIRRIPRVLYHYRRHAGQRTSVQGVADIQARSALLWWERAESIGLRWCLDRRLSSLLLGQRADDPRYTMTVDVDPRPGAIGFDLTGAWPIRSDSCGYIRAHHVLEHLADPVHAMASAWRVLAHGGILDLEVPLAPGVGAFADPTHRSFWVRQSLAYYTDAAFASYISGSTRGFARIEGDGWARFQLVAAEEHELALGGSLAGQKVPVLRATLAALKECGARLPGPNYWRS